MTLPPNTSPLWTILRLLIIVVYLYIDCSDFNGDEIRNILVSAGVIGVPLGSKKG